MFAIEGQIYEADSVILLDKDLNMNQRRQLVFDTTCQMMFLEALQKIMPFLQKKKGLHPNIREVSEFTDEDKNRLNALKNTVEYYKGLTPPIEAVGDTKPHVVTMMNKMFDAICDMPDAWNDDGTIKEEYKDKYFQDLKSAKDMGLF